MLYLYQFYKRCVFSVVNEVRTTLSAREVGIRTPAPLFLLSLKPPLSVIDIVLLFVLLLVILFLVTFHQNAYIDLGNKKRTQEFIFQKGNFVKEKNNNLSNLKKRHFRSFVFMIHLSTILCTILQFSSLYQKTSLN